MSEEWREVNGFKRYRVSDQGRVKNALTGQILSGTKTKCGYLQVQILSDEGDAKCCRVHRLVATACHGPPPPGFVCDHVNGDKLCNRAGNLEWVTRAENNRRAAALGLLKGKSAGSKNPNAKLSDEKVVEMRRKAAGGVSYTELAAEYGVTVPTVSRAVVGKLWGHVPAEPVLSA